MSYSIYNRHECNVAFDKEASYRTGTMTEEQAKPFDVFEEVEVPEPMKEWEEIFPVHAGRNVGNVGDKTYPVAEGSIETFLQSGIWLYYALGASSDVLSTFWTHTITESNDLPSFNLHFEQLNSGSGTDIVRELIGCMVTELAISIAKDSLIKQTISFIVPKSVTASKFTTTTWSSFNFSDKLMNWDMAALSTFTINTVDLLTAWGTIPIETLDINIKNEVECLPNLGDPYLNEPKIGKREYEIKMMIYPKDDDLYNARDLHPEDYTGAITILINRGTNDEIELTFSDMYVSDYPNKIPNVDDKEVGVEVTFRNSPGGTLAVVVEDALDESYYDNVDDTV